jgi:hypothetical protein
VGFIGQDAFFGLAAPFSFLTADLFEACALGGRLARLQLFNLVQQETTGNEPIKSLLARGLALHLQLGWAMQEHDARGRLIDVLAAVPSGPHKRFFEIGFKDS